MNTKYCEYCGNKIVADAVICPNCGKQVEELKSSEEKTSPQVIINNTNISGVNGRKCDKWVAILLCIFLGFLGGHKFYEGKGGMGIIYILTCGFLGIGIIIDLIVLLFRNNPYYV